MKHELDDNSEVRLAIDGDPITDESLRYAFFEGLKQHITNWYKMQRQCEYPPITDYIDGIVKGDQSQIDKYIADCQAVKAKYPKPTE